MNIKTYIKVTLLFTLHYIILNQQYNQHKSTYLYIQGNLEIIYLYIAKASYYNGLRYSLS